MTLAIGLATPGYAIAVADRRLSWPNGKFADDDAFKIVMFCNHMAFAWTGAAILEGKKTDRWIADELSALSDQSILDAANRLRDRATEVFRRPGWPRGTPFSFIGVGFTRETDSPPSTAIILSV